MILELFPGALGIRFCLCGFCIGGSCMGVLALPVLVLRVFAFVAFVFFMGWSSGRDARGNFKKLSFRAEQADFALHSRSE
jgi:hypothetical protein